MIFLIYIFINPSINQQDFRENHFLFTFLIAFLSLFIIGCSNNNTTKNNEIESKTQNVTKEKATSKVTTNATTNKVTKENETISYNQDDLTVDKIKSTAKLAFKKSLDDAKDKYDLSDEIINELDSIYVEIIEKIDYLDGEIEAVKEKLNEYYLYFNKAIELYQNTKATLAELKASVLKEIDNLYNSLNLSSNKEKIDECYQELKTKINDAKDTAEVKELYKEYSALMIKYATMTLNTAYEKVIETYLVELKNLYDTYYPLLTEENIKNTVSSLYQKYTLELKSIIASTKTEYEEKAKKILNEFKADAYEYVKNKINLTIDEYKELILSEINVLYEKANILITDADIKEYLDKYYELQKQAVEKLSTIDDCKNMLEDVISSSKDIVKEISIKYLADAKLALKTKINELVDEALKKIDNEEIKTNINSFYQEELSKIDKINDVDDLKTKSNEILKDTENKIKEFVLAQVTIYKNKAIEFLDENIKSLIDKITDEEIKTKVTNFYNTEKAKIENINDIDSAKEIGTTIANDAQEFLKDISGDLIDIGKSYAKVELKKLVDQALEYITDEDLKKELNDFYTQEIEKIDKIDSKEKVESTTTEVLNDTKEKIEDIVKRYLVKIKADLKTKLDNLVNSALLNITDEDLRKEINDFYTQ